MEVQPASSCNIEDEEDDEDIEGVHDDQEFHHKHEPFMYEDNSSDSHSTHVVGDEGH